MRHIFSGFILQFLGVKVRIIEIVGCESQDNRKGVIC
jgi:hypothetical protein